MRHIFKVKKNTVSLNLFLIVNVLKRKIRNIYDIQVECTFSASNVHVLYCMQNVKKIVSKKGNGNKTCFDTRFPY